MTKVYVWCILDFAAVLYLLFAFNTSNNTLKLVYEIDIHPNYAIIQIASTLTFDSSQDVD